MALPLTGNTRGGTRLGAAGMGIVQFRYTEFDKSVKYRCPADSWIDMSDVLKIFQE